MAHSQCDLQGDVLHKSGQQVWHRKALQKFLLVGFKELTAQRLGRELTIERMLVQLFQQRNVDLTATGKLAIAVVW